MQQVFLTLARIALRKLASGKKREAICTDRAELCSSSVRNCPKKRILSRAALPFGRLWYGGPNAVSNAIGYAKHRSRSHDAVIRVTTSLNHVIETHEHAGRVQGVVSLAFLASGQT